MAGKRQQTEAFIIAHINELTGGTSNEPLYTQLFASMDDKAFDKFMADLDSGEQQLCVVAPNFGKEKLSVPRNLAIAERLGHQFFQRVWIPAKGEVPSYLSPIPYLVVDLPLRRQAQILQKKISIPEDNNSVDDFTGQPTGKSKGSRVSYPETQVLAALGLNSCLTEFLKYRGGDEKGFNAMNTMINRTGGVSMNAIEPFSGKVKSTSTLKSVLAGMHLKSTL
jgi:hypothetical protein